jgi:acetyl esterase/lipase
MIKALYIFCVLAFGVGLLYHFAALKAFNFLVPKDQTSQLRAANVAYGPHPSQRLDIYEPKFKAGNLPILIFVHGGSWAAGNQTDYSFAGRAFAAKGYLTIVMSYRGLPESAYPDFIIDVAEVVKWATLKGASYGGDGKAIFLVGHSAGAFNIALATLDQHYFKDAGLDPTVVKAVATLAGPFDFLPLDSPATIATFGHVKYLAATQPINFARVDAPPFLLLYGLKDKTVYRKNSISLQAHLLANGAKATLIEYDDVTHVGILMVLAKPFRNYAPVLEDIDKFFKDILR